jgi:hypothetical protein
MKTAVSTNPPGSRRARIFLAVAAAVCVGIPAPAWAQIATVVQKITSAAVGNEVVVTIEANGPLPAPTVGTVDGPPRIFLDFPGVRTITSGLVRAADPRVLRVRAAINSVKPLVTRVVLDLSAQQPHRIELATGRVLIFIGATTAQPSTPPRAAPKSSPATAEAPPPAATAVPPPAWPPATDTAGAAPPTTAPTTAATTASPIAPVPPLPEPPAVTAKPAATETARSVPRTAATRDSAGSRTSGRASNRTTTPPPPIKDLERYRNNVSPLLLRLRMQQPLLESLGSLEDQVPVRMQSAMEEFDTLRQELSAVKPPDTLKPQHELLMQVTRLGMTAARLRLESIKSPDGAVVRNAASAATGAILMLDRACVDLACPGPPGR